jgi:hypothetical protein
LIRAGRGGELEQFNLETGHATVGFEEVVDLADATALESDLDSGRGPSGLISVSLPTRESAR